MPAAKSKRRNADPNSVPGGLTMPVETVSRATIADWLGVSINTLQRGMNRHPGYPVPFTRTTVPGRAPGIMGRAERTWLPTTRQAWIDWRDSWPGQGAKGTRKPRRNKPAGAGAPIDGEGDS